MPKLWKHKNGTWYVLHGPRLQKRVSTRQTGRAEAEAFLARFVAGSLEPTLESPTVRSILEGYRDDHGRGLRGQDGLIYGVAALSKRLGNLHADDLTPTVIKRYAAERGAKPGTILREVGILRAALGWAVAHKLISSRPTVPNPVPAPPARERWLSKDEARKLLDACREPHVRLFMMLGMMTLARMSAILEARWGQVDWENQNINYGAGHGNKRRTTVKINPELLDALKSHHAIAITPYIVEYHGRRVKTVKKGFAGACGRAKIEGVTPHILRHSGASWAAMERVPLAEIANLLGDREAVTERVYRKFTPEYQRRATAALQLGIGGDEKRLTSAGNPPDSGPSEGNKT